MLFNVLLGLGIAAFVAGVWCTIGLANSSATGWGELAERFHYSRRFHGRMYRFKNGGPSRGEPLAQAGSEVYPGLLNVGMSEEGLYLAHVFPFRLFRKPLLIPWGEMTAEPYEKFLFFGYRVSLRSFPGIALYFYGEWFHDAAGYLKDLRSL